MTRAGFLLLSSLFGTALLASGCSAVPTCDELAFYERATGGKRIEPPDDLDPLDFHKEMVIPEASPRPPRDLKAGCLERPPTLTTGEDENAGR